MNRPRGPRLDLRHQSGTGVVEVAVVVAVLGAAIAVFLGSLSSLHFEVHTDDPTTPTPDGQPGRVLILRLSKDLRAAAALRPDASPLVLAADGELRFYARIDASGAYTTAPGLVRLHIDRSGSSGPVLVEEVTSPDAGAVTPNWTYQRNAPRVRLSGGYVVNSRDQPVFTYYDAAGTVLCPTPLSPGQLLLVRTVGITLVVADSAAPYAPTTTLINRVKLPAPQP